MSTYKYISLVVTLTFIKYLVKHSNKKKMFTYIFENRNRCHFGELLASFDRSFVHFHS